MVSAAKRDGKRVIAVTLCDPDDWSDHKNMLEYGLNAIKLTEVSPDAFEYDIPVISGEKSFLKIEIEPHNISSVDNSDFSVEIELPQFIYAPVNQGEQIGYAVYKKNDTVIEKLPICAETAIKTAKVKRSLSTEIINSLKDIFKNIWEK